MARRRVAMQIETAGRLEDAMQFNEARRHHREVSHHGGVFEEAVEGFHHLRHGEIRAGVNELVVSLGGGGPSPGVGEGVELRLAGFAGGAFWGGPGLARQSARDGFSARVRATMRSRCGWQHRNPSANG